MHCHPVKVLKIQSSVTVITVFTAFHAETVKTLSEEDVENYTNRIADLQACCAELSEIEPSNESLQVSVRLMTLNSK